MKQFNFAVLATALMTVIASPAHAAITISEVDANGSAATSGYAADWFELTNTGVSAVDITGWKMDDNSNSFASAVALRGVTSIAAGQSVVFIEGTASGSTDSTINAAFKAAWFGSNAPASLVIGNYGGSGVGLSSSGDAVNIFNASGNGINRVDFGASTLGQTFDNAAGLSNVTISQLSAAGVNGAFQSYNAAEIGSPGSVATVPEPETYGMLFGGLGLMGFMTRRRKNEKA
jgi:hypothetical protein